LIIFNGVSMEKNFLKTYCVVGLNNIEELKEDLTIISETNVNFVSGSGLIIATFNSTFNLLEIKELLDMGKKSYIVFEMTPGFYAANLEDKSFEVALFGKQLNILPFEQIQEALKNIKNEIFGEITDYGLKSTIEKSTEEKLKDALDKEDYETAAKLRDQIKNKK
jgi:hypothetical protein